MKTLRERLEAVAECKTTKISTVLLKITPDDCRKLLALIKTAEELDEATAIVGGDFSPRDRFKAAWADLDK